MTLTPEQLHILQHSLGCGKYGCSPSRLHDELDGCFGYHRNRYVSDPDPDLIALVASGHLFDRAFLDADCGYSFGEWLRSR